jgi:hypothetical protein
LAGSKLPGKLRIERMILEDRLDISASGAPAAYFKRPCGNCPSRNVVDLPKLFTPA